MFDNFDDFKLVKRKKTGINEIVLSDSVGQKD
jgi:hypothetical protein